MLSRVCVLLRFGDDVEDGPDADEYAAQHGP